MIIKLKVGDITCNVFHSIFAVWSYWSIYRPGGMFSVTSNTIIIPSQNYALDATAVLLGHVRNSMVLLHQIKVVIFKILIKISFQEENYL